MIEIKYDNDVEKISEKISNLTSDFGPWLAKELTNLLQKRFQSSGIQTKTGNLARSIQVRYNQSNKTLSWGILMYGIFLSYGVGPYVKRGKVYPVDKWVLDQLDATPNGNNRFAFKPDNRKFGIPARKWIPGDDAIQAIIEDFEKEYTI